MNIFAIAAFGASTIVPAQPTSFETVNLRIPSHSCNFAESTVRVSMEANVIRVSRDGDNCSPPGVPIVADVRLGAFPSGDYRVELGNFRLSTVPSETITFQVRDPVEITVFPPPTRPLTKYTGLWMNRQESGWGLSLHQGARYTMFGLLFVYGPGNQPEWYSLQSGRWTSSTIWTATVFRTTGPSLSASVFNPAQVDYSNVGTATLDFTQAPGQEGRARFTYSIGSVNAAKTIERMGL